MTTCKQKRVKKVLFSGVAAAALMAAPQLLDTASNGTSHAGAALAQEHGAGQGGHQGGAQGSGKGPGYRGGRTTTGAPEGSAGQGGPGEDSDAKGPRYQGGTNVGSGGGKPVWAQEGIPEVELGRLNVARSPSKVIDKALAEALANFDPSASAALYSMTAEAFAAYVKANYDAVTRVDSPLENLGLYKDVVSDGATQLPGVTNTKVDLAAIFLGSASDKNVAVSADTVVAVTKILGLTLTDAEIASVAAKAEIVRAAILEGHG